MSGASSRRPRPQGADLVADNNQVQPQPDQTTDQPGQVEQVRPDLADVEPNERPRRGTVPGRPRRRRRQLRRQRHRRTGESRRPSTNVPGCTSGPPAGAGLPPPRPEDGRRRRRRGVNGYYDTIDVALLADGGVRVDRQRPRRPRRHRRRRGPPSGKIVVGVLRVGEQVQRQRVRGLQRVARRQRLSRRRAPQRLAVEIRAADPERVEQSCAIGVPDARSRRARSATRPAPRSRSRPTPTSRDHRVRARDTAASAPGG